MKKFLLLRSVCMLCFLPIVFTLSAQDKDKKMLEKLKHGEYTLQTFYLPGETYAYEIVKDNKIVYSEVVRPALGTPLAFKSKKELKEEIMKMARFVLKMQIQKKQLQRSKLHSEINICVRNQLKQNATSLLIPPNLSTKDFIELE